MKLQSSLITLGLVFVMLFGMAFQCGNNGSSGTSSSGAPTEQEVKQAIEKFTREFHDSYNGSKARVSSWDSPIQILAGRKDYVNTDSGGDHMMYPVKVDYTVSVEGKGATKYTGGALGFHKNAFGEWKYYTLENYQRK